MNKICPNCNTKCKDFDLNTIQIDEFKIIRKLANQNEGEFNVLSFQELGHIVYSMLYEKMEELSHE